MLSSARFILILTLISYLIAFSQEGEILYQGRISHQYHIALVSDGTEGPYSISVNGIIESTIEIYINSKNIPKSDFKLGSDGKSVVFLYPVTIGYSIDIYFDIFEVKEVTGAEPISQGGNFNITGSKNFTVSTTSEGQTTIDQGTRLRFYGTVSGLEVEGRLTDEELPITPEGSSEEISAIDQVSVKVNGYGMNLEMGDIDVEGGGSKFLSYRRHLLGATGFYKNESFAGGGTAAIARGEHASTELNGEDGIQGPYIITLPDAYSITIVPLSERVFLNGELMKRGDNLDYTIDYYEPSITFTRNRLITSSSRIYIEFDYSELGYKRNFYSGRSNVNFGGSALNIGFETAFEEDDPKSDLIGLTGDDKKRLFMAGDNSKEAYRVAKDENGDIIYEYAGQGKGDYKRQWSDTEKKFVYIYVGENMGDYRQVTYYIPMPQKKLVFDIESGINIGKRVNMKLSLATSNCDLNLISPFNDNDNIGSAVSFQLSGKPFIGEKSSLIITGKGYKRDARFNSIDNVERAEDLKKWEIEEEETNPTVYEYAIEGSFISTLFKTATFEYARTSRLFGSGEGKFDSIEGDLYRTKFDIKSDRFGSHKIEARLLDKMVNLRINNNDITDGERAQKRHYVDISGRDSRKLSIFEPYDIYEYTERFLDRRADSSLDKGSVMFGAGPGLSITPAHLSLDINYEQLGEKEVTLGQFHKSYKGNQAYLNGRLDLKSFTLDFGGTVRKIDYISPDKLDVYQDVGTAGITAHPLSENTTISAKYKMTSEREYEREEVFIVAENRNGDYRREEDPTNPGHYIYVYDPDDEDAIYIRVLRPTGEFFPISGVEGLFSISYERRTGEERSPISFSGYISVSERTKDKRKARVYSFLSTMTDMTIEGNIRKSFSITLLPSNMFFSPRLGYDDSRGLDRIITDVESRNWSRVLSLDINSSPIGFFSLNYGGSYNRFTEENSSKGLGVVRRKNGWESAIKAGPHINILSNLSLKTNFIQTVRFERNDNLSGRFLVLDINPSLLFSPYTRGSISLDYTLERVKTKGHTGTMYIYTHPEGISHDLTCSFRHELPQYITLTLSYILDKDPDKPFEHKARFDVSAYF